MSIAKSKQIVFLLLAFMAPGCGSQDESAEKAAGVTETHPVRGGTAIVVFQSEPQHLIPYGPPDQMASEMHGFIFSQLAETAANYLDFEPSVAESWEYNADHTELTMHLRTDVYWSDGVQLTSADVLFTNEIAADPDVAWGSSAWKDDIEKVEAIDPFTVRFFLKRAFRESFRYAKSSYLIPKHLLGDQPRHKWGSLEFARQPVGCGPYKLASWEPGQRIILERNEYYFRPGLPYLDRIVIEFNSDPMVRLQRLRTHLVDFVADLDPADADRLRQEKDAGKSNVRVQSARGRLYHQIAYNLNRPMFQDRKVRKALTLALDRKKIVDGLCYGFAELFEGPIIPSFWGFDAEMPLTPYDAPAARKLLEQAGWSDHDGDGWIDKDGQRFEFTLLVPTSNNLRRSAAVPIQQDWKNVGVKVDIAFLEASATADRRNKRDYDAYFGGWSSNISGNFVPIWGCESRNGRLNYIDYCNPRVGELNAKALGVVVPQDAIPYYRELQTLVAHDYPYTWMYYLHDVAGVNDRLKNVVVDARGSFVNIDEWWIPVAAQKHH